MGDILTTSVTLLAIYFAISVSKFEAWRKYGKLMGVVVFFAVVAAICIPNGIYSRFTSSDKTMRAFELFGKVPIYGIEIVDITTWLIACVALFIATSYALGRKINLK